MGDHKSYFLNTIKTVKVTKDKVNFKRVICLRNEKKYCARLQKSLGVVKQCKKQKFIIRCISKMRGIPAFY